MKKFINFSVKKFWLLIFIWFCMLIFSNAGIGGYIFSFAVPLTFVLILNDVYGIYSIAVFFICSLLHGITFENLVSSALVVSLLIIFMITKRFLNKHQILFAMLFFFFSRIANIYFLSYSVQSTIWALIDLILSVSFVYIINIVMFAYFSRGMQAFVRKEIICLYCCTIILFSGLSNIYLFSLNVSNFIFVLFILCAVGIFKERSIISVFCLNCGYMLSTFNFTFLPLYFLSLRMAFIGYLRCFL